ncbi:hypothetical protein [Paenibacillus alvei]|uniref:Uncharacterized protein n=2 Tax=Paenibacillus alvei TaxID=44250 RepID=A0ABT4H6S5_PAEAL|nr:hypothetical protein [Paenibacillus alvei]MCY9764686.1 hypothetical protein [Paenibacillus alvei]
MINFATATTLQLCMVIQDQQATEEDKQQASKEIWNRIGKDGEYDDMPSTGLQEGSH